jgi:hypothetical protein
VNIPKSYEEINENTEGGKVLMKKADLNEIAYMELILLIDVRSSSGNVVFSIIKGCKSRDYTDGNSSSAWGKLKKKFDPVYDPSLVKTERVFRQSKLERGEEPEIWITNLKEIRLKLEDMGSHMTDSQFFVQVLNSLANDYELQMVLMEKRIGNKVNPLTIDELQEDSTL